MGQQLADQAMCVLDKTLACGFVVAGPGTVRMMPVHQRVVEADTQTFGTGCIHKFTYQIAAWTLFSCAVIGELGVPHAETFMVLGGHHHVFLSGAPRELGPVTGGIR